MEFTKEVVNQIDKVAQAFFKVKAAGLLFERVKKRMNANPAMAGHEQKSACLIDLYQGFSYTQKFFR